MTNQQLDLFGSNERDASSVPQTPLPEQLDLLTPACPICLDTGRVITKHRGPSVRCTCPAGFIQEDTSK